MVASEALAPFLVLADRSASLVCALDDDGVVVADWVASWAASGTATCTLLAHVGSPKLQLRGA